MIPSILAKNEVFIRSDLQKSKKCIDRDLDVNPVARYTISFQLCRKAFIFMPLSVSHNSSSFSGYCQIGTRPPKLISFASYEY